jgi:hypothetical protein
MKSAASNYRNLLVETVIAAMTCICVGLIAYGFAVFNIYSHKFVFVAEGVTGSFAFYSLRRLGGRDTLVFVCILFLFEVVLLTRTTGATRIFIEFVFFAAVPIASAVFFWSYRKHMNEVKLYDPFILGAFCAVLISIARAIYYGVSVIRHVDPSWQAGIPFSFSETLESFLIGLGIGLGLWILDRPEVIRQLHLTKGFVARAA